MELDRTEIKLDRKQAADPRSGSGLSLLGLHRDAPTWAGLRIDDRHVLFRTCTISRHKQATVSNYLPSIFHNQSCQHAADGAENQKAGGGHVAWEANYRMSRRWRHRNTLLEPESLFIQIKIKSWISFSVAKVLLGYVNEVSSKSCLFVNFTFLLYC